MDNITEYMMRQLQSAGFRYPDYEHNLNSGMLYAYEGTEYCIGWDGTEFSETDRLVAEKGLWLPDGDQLLRWLTENGFRIKIDWDCETESFQINAADQNKNCQYTGGGKPLSYALHKVIYKICKSNPGQYIPENTLRLTILKDED
jgi:hypothetical protein